MRIPVAPEGVPIIKWSFFVWMLVWLTLSPIIIGCATVFLLFICAFFRDPLRQIHRDNGHAYAAADGKITQINDVDINGTPYYQIVTFLSVFNCHVNRVPLSGTVLKTNHIPGKFLAAMRGDIDKKNERQETDFETSIGLVRVVQITGAIARRICCDLAPNQTVSIGDRFGLIRFGSRTDVYLRKDMVIPTCVVGDSVKGGLSKLARISKPPPH